MTTMVQGDQLRTITQGLMVSRTAASLPQTASTGIFTITGDILLLGIFGEVTTVFQAQANLMKLVFNPTLAGASSDLSVSTASDVTGLAVGTRLALPAAGTSVLVILAVPRSLGAGQIELSTSASSTGAAKWDLFYVPFNNGGSVVAA
jgi:hypothetical protein